MRCLLSELLHPNTQHCGLLTHPTTSLPGPLSTIVAMYLNISDVAAVSFNGQFDFFQKGKVSSPVLSGRVDKIQKVSGHMIK